MSSRSSALPNLESHWERCRLAAVSLMISSTWTRSVCDGVYPLRLLSASEIVAASRYAVRTCTLSFLIRIRIAHVFTFFDLGRSLLSPVSEAPGSRSAYCLVSLEPRRLARPRRTMREEADDCG